MAMELLGAAAAATAAAAAVAAFGTTETEPLEAGVLDLGRAGGCLLPLAAAAGWLDVPLPGPFRQSAEEKKKDNKKKKRKEKRKAISVGPNRGVRRGATNCIKAYRWCCAVLAATAPKCSHPDSQAARSR